MLHVNNQSLSRTNYYQTMLSIYPSSLLLSKTMVMNYFRWSFNVHSSHMSFYTRKLCPVTMKDFLIEWRTKLFMPKRFLPRGKWSRKPRTISIPTSYHLPQRYAYLIHSFFPNLFFFLRRHKLLRSVFTLSRHCAKCIIKSKISYEWGQLQL